MCAGWCCHVGIVQGMDEEDNNVGGAIYLVASLGVVRKRKTVQGHPAKHALLGCTCQRKSKRSIGREDACWSKGYVSGVRWGVGCGLWVVVSKL